MNIATIRDYLKGVFSREKGVAKTKNNLETEPKATVVENTTSERTTPISRRELLLINAKLVKIGRRFSDSNIKRYEKETKEVLNDTTAVFPIEKFIGIENYINERHPEYSEK